MAPALWLIAATASTLQAQDAPYPTDVTEATLADAAELARLQAPGELFFEDDFEADELGRQWFGRIGEDKGLVRLEAGADVAHAGDRALRMDAEDRGGRECAAGANYWFHPGHDVVHFRRYIRFADDYDQGNLNHVGGSLYAIAGEDRWGGMGKAGIRPKGDDRFGAGFEPWRDWGRNEPPGAMMLYTYWVDMKGGPDGQCWGNNLQPPDEKLVKLRPGTWHCLEQMIRANTPGQADGEMAAWIDGQLYIHLTGFRWRTVADVKLKRISLGLYIHESTRANTVWYDDVALSTGYVGAME